MINRIAEFFVAGKVPAGGQRGPPPARLSRKMQIQRGTIEELIRQNPGWALVGAALLGAALAWWIKRR